MLSYIQVNQVPFHSSNFKDAFFTYFTVARRKENKMCKKKNLNSAKNKKLPMKETQVQIQKSTQIKKTQRKWNIGDGVQMHLNGSGTF